MQADGIKGARHHSKENVNKNVAQKTQNQNGDICVMR